ncbi:MAG: radical SAM protein [Nitrosarchaeum sp.]|nr:radical SAM protein [Nitrosarchaeum sp.]
MIDIRKNKNGYWWKAQEKFDALISGVVKLTELTIQVTDLCNMNCPKCNKINMTSDHMKVKDVVRILNDAAKLGLQHVHLTGGEPTMHPDLVEIIDLCRQLDMRVDMSSNGKFSEWKYANLANAGLNSINISWDFIKQVPECIDFVENYSPRVFVNHMVMPSNYKEMPKFLQMIKDDYRYVHDIQLMPPRGSADKFNEKQIKEFNEIYIDKCYMIVKNCFPMVRTKIKEILNDKDATKGIYHKKITWPCHRARAELRVGPKGFAPCTYLYRDGFILCGLDVRVKEAWNRSMKMCQAMPPNKDMCDLSCSPEVSGLNYFVEKELTK